MPRKKPIVTNAVVWLSENVSMNENNEVTNLRYYNKFQFKNIAAGIGDFVLVSNADAAEPDTEEGCDAAQIMALYENPENKKDPFRAKVQWYSKPSDLPRWFYKNISYIQFTENEVIEDHRSFDNDVSIETFFKKCHIIKSFTNFEPSEVIDNTTLYSYICRYRLTALSKRKIHIEPVLEQERIAQELLRTPNKNMIASSRTPKTPNTLIKKMNEFSLSEHRNWSVSKADGTKLLLKRALLTDKTERNSPKSTPKKEEKLLKTPKSSKKLNRNEIRDILSMELQENSDEELPTLIIRERSPCTPKKNISLIYNEVTPIKGINNSTDSMRKSSRSIKQPVRYFEEDISPVKTTPKRSIKSRIFSDGSDEEFELPPRSLRTPNRTSVARTVRTPNKSPISKILRTPSKISIPKSPRTPRTPKTLDRTPKKSVLKKISTSQLTPTLKTRKHSIEESKVIVEDSKLLPGRENQMEEILSFIRTKLLDGNSGCMYISGVPGTGKTATVSLALQMLKNENNLPNFQLVEVNGMRIAEPRQAYVQIYKQLTGKTVAWAQACSLLEKRFTNSGPRRTPTVLVVDELDALCTRRQDVLYHIMEWAARGPALLAVLAVANTMDLPERALAARVASRLGLTRLTFPPYSHAQLQRIVATKLAHASVTADAMQLIARKVAAVSGDARRALALCDRALELAAGGGAGLREVQRALGEAAAGAGARAIRNCSAAERLMLRAIAAEAERTGSDETTLSRSLLAATAIVSLDGRPYKSAANVRAPTPAQAHAACARLAASKLILLEPKAAEPRLMLNVSADDVHYATRQITI